MKSAQVRGVSYFAVFVCDSAPLRENILHEKGNLAQRRQSAKMRKVKPAQFSISLAISRRPTGRSFAAAPLALSH